MKRFQTILAISLCILLSGCVRTPSRPPAVTVPPLAFSLPFDEDKPPLLDVFIIEENETRTMDLEAYVCGVVAGEMRSDWPIEALRAQAILARTFVLKFVTEKQSRYSGADISTDIAEAQAYDAGAVNDRIRQAVRSTAGMVLITGDGALPYPWFHAHSGGQTALAREGIDWQGDEPGYVVSTQGRESDRAPDSARAWEAVFSREDFLNACQDVGAHPERLRDVAVGQRGVSGRAVTIRVDGIDINAARLRVALGSTVMRSTLLTELSSDGESVRMAGRGYGHGVGMPQWGAYALAEDGFSGEEISLHYYSDLRLVSLWPPTASDDD